ncbi:MAG: nitroreductase family protein [Thermoanaerobaculales bacterium]|jgi:nitroreductase|nr:nitroreductase family protein [Thermoanaerobaculales bacterium]
MTTEKYPTVPFEFERRHDKESRFRGQAMLDSLRRRRSIREFSTDPVPRFLIETAIASAATAPSGANRQPWHFVAVSDPVIKKKIRRAAEAEERAFYEGGRTPDEWLEALAPLGTDADKPFLEDAPWLVVVFKEVQGVAEDGSKVTNYYVNESVGIACGLFISSLQHMGLVTLTHTPQPMRFLNEIVGRPKNERPFILFPVGYPAENCRVPDITKKPFDDITTWLE